MPSHDAANVPEELARQVVDAAFRVHYALGPGLLESAYEMCLCREFQMRQINFRRQVPVPVVYEGLRLESGYQLDLLVGGEVIVELKAVEELLPVHKAQLSYLKLTQKQLGLLINFNVPKIKDGIHRVIRR
jgi:GxxExxY protein